MTGNVLSLRLRAARSFAIYRGESRRPTGLMVGLAGPTLGPHGLIFHQVMLCLVLVFLNANKNNLQAHKIIVVALHPEVFRVSYFPQGMEILF
jgi:hypothetical protein